MTTMHDVARLAKVSSKTVSRVLNRDPAVKSATRQKIEAAMEALNYRPSQSARALRLGNTESIGLLLEDPSSGYQSRFHHALLMACMAKGKFLSVELFDPALAHWPEILDDYIKKARITQMILLPPLCDYTPMREFMKARKINCILISPVGPDKEYSSVAVDDRQAGRDATDYLIRLGHRRIAHIIGHPDHAASMSRRLGYYDAFDIHNLPRPNKQLEQQGDWTFRSGFEKTEILLNLPEPPTAIFAANDQMAAGVCSAAHRHSIRIPMDLSIIGFDDAPLAASIWPALTTVSQPYLEMSKKAIELLEAGRRNESTEIQINYIANHQIIERESCQAIASEA